MSVQRSQNPVSSHYRCPTSAARQQDWPWRGCVSLAPWQWPLDYLDPEAIEGDDDWYLGVVLKYGDTVSSEAQVAAARSLGFDADFRTNGSLTKVEELLIAVSLFLWASCTTAPLTTQPVAVIGSA